MQPGLGSRQPWKPEERKKTSSLVFSPEQTNDSGERAPQAYYPLINQDPLHTEEHQEFFNAGVKPEGGAITRAYGKLCWLNGRPLRADWPKIWIAVGTVRHVECIWPLAEQDSFLGRSKQPLLHWKSRSKDTSLKAIIWKEKKKKVSLDAKHRKNCECCPGHHLIVDHYSSI